VGCAGSSICFPFWSYGGLELAHVALCFTHVSFLSLVLLVMQTVLLQAVARACVRAMRVPLVSLPANGQTILLAAVQDVWLVICKGLHRVWRTICICTNACTNGPCECYRHTHTHTHTHSKIACAVVHGEARLFPRHVHHIFAKEKRGSLHKQTRKQETRLTCGLRKV